MSEMGEHQIAAGIQQKDTTFTKIFVGGLPYHTTDKSLRQFFETFGEIEEAVVITDRQTGKSRGYGFVTMADREAAERAVKEANPIIDGRKANVNLAYLGAKPRINAQNGFASPLRAGFPLMISSQYGLPSHYLYPSAYLHTPGLILPPHAPLSPAAAAAAAAAANPFYDYATTYPPQYSNSLDPSYPFAVAAAGAAAAVAASGHNSTPYIPSAAYAYTIPQPIPAGTPAHFPVSYATQPQETRMQ